MQSVHLIPTTFVLQVHCPLVSHDVDDDPEVLHSHAEKVLDVPNKYFSRNGIIEMVEFLPLQLGNS